MAAVLLVNNIPFPAADGGLETSLREIGAVGQAFDGSLRRTRSAIKRDLSVASVLLPASEALAWQRLLEGEGELWTFDAGFFGSKGTGPTGSIEAAAIVPGEGRFGAAALRVALGDTVSYAGLYAAGYTAILWRRPAGGAGATWAHWVVRSDGARWRDGATTTDPAPPVFAASGGGVTITGSGEGTAVYVDELVVLPFLVPDSWPAAIYGLAALGRTFSSLPRLVLSGTAILEGGTRTVLGMVEASSLIQAASPMLAVSASLQET